MCSCAVRPLLCGLRRPVRARVSQAGEVREAQVRGREGCPEAELEKPTSVPGGEVTDGDKSFLSFEKNE